MDRRKNRLPQCKLCKGKGVPFVRSHIIPRSFFKQFRGSDPHTIVASASDGKIEKIQAGFWDGNMLCEACEKKFSDLDSYGWKILGSSKLTDKPLYHHFQLYGYEVDCEVDKLHKFILSVFWRACAARIDAFEKFRLFKYEVDLLTDIFDRKSLDTRLYQTIVFRLDKEILGELSHLMFEPLAHPQKDGSYMCQMNLPSLKIVTFINSAMRCPEWMRLYAQKRFTMPFLPASMNQQEVRFLIEWHEKFSGHGKST